MLFFEKKNIMLASLSVWSVCGRIRYVKFKLKNVDRWAIDRVLPPQITVTTIDRTSMASDFAVFILISCDFSYSSHMVACEAHLQHQYVMSIKWIAFDRSIDMAWNSGTKISNELDKTTKWMTKREEKNSQDKVHHLALYLPSVIHFIWSCLFSVWLSCMW